MSAIRELDRPMPKPRWGWLYAFLVLLGGLLTLVELTIPDGLARRTLEIAVVLATLGAIALWVRANRVALALANEEHCRRPAAPELVHGLAPRRKAR
jgi:hypothetical protein